MGDWLLEVVVPGKPVGAARPRVTKHGTYIPKHVKAWERAAVARMRRAWGRGEIHTDIGVEVEVVQVQHRPQRLRRRRDPEGRFPAERGKPDLDNVAKLAIDALVRAGVLVDDTRVVRLTAMKLYASMDEEPCTEVRVREVA